MQGQRCSQQEASSSLELCRVLLAPSLVGLAGKGGSLAASRGPAPWIGGS